MPQGCSRSIRTAHGLLTECAEQEDVQANVYTFELTVEREGWGRQNWMYILTPYLSGEAVLLPRVVDADYDTIKADVLHTYLASPPWLPHSSFMNGRPL